MSDLHFVFVEYFTHDNQIFGTFRVKANTKRIKPILFCGVMKHLIGFPVTPKWLTLNDLEMPFHHANICFHRPFDYIFLRRLRRQLCEKGMKILPHCQQRKCLSEIVVSDDIRFMWIFAAVLAWGGVTQLTVGGQKLPSKATNFQCC